MNLLIALGRACESLLPETIWVVSEGCEFGCIRYPIAAFHTREEAQRAFDGAFSDPQDPEERYSKGPFLHEMGKEGFLKFIGLRS